MKPSRCTKHMSSTIQYCEMKIATPPSVQMRGLHCWVMMARVTCLIRTSMCHFNVTYTELGSFEVVLLLAERNYAFQ
jgi:hypothetical protein